MRRPLAICAAIFALSLLPPALPVRSQGAAPTLAQALARAEVPRDTVYLAVAAETVALPKGADPTPLSPGAPVPQVADAYGRITQSWETAGAVAPPTMTVLNTDPGIPDAREEMPFEDTLKLLLGSLDNSQWQALTGSQGLGLADLTSQSQWHLFNALFPGGRLDVQMSGSAGGAITLSSGDLQQTRLRLSQQVQILLQDADNTGGYSGNGAGSDDGKARYTAWPGSGLADAGDTLYGVMVRASVPNAPKAGDMDWDAETMKVPVPVAGIKTVRDLICRVGTATNTELYADLRYEKRSVTLVGSPSARAGDLLRALALCVCGTYRRVGPAYVLTDDLIGMGTRQRILARFTQAAEMARGVAEADAGDKLVARGGVLALPPCGPGLGLTDAQKASQNGDRFLNVTVPFDQLTPQQQDIARREFQKFQGDRMAAPAAYASSSPVTLGGRVMLEPQAVLQFLSPAVPGPVTLAGNPRNLFQPSAELRQKMGEEYNARMWAEWRKQQSDHSKSAPAAPVPAPSPSLTSLLAALPRRGVLAHPRTASDVDAVIASMRKIGLNQLWLDVFSGGKSHLDGTPDILAEARAKTTGTGITIIPTLDLLGWGADAPDEAADRTILGETSAQTADYLQRYRVATQGMTAEEAAALPPSQSVSACPAAPAVVGTLTALVRRLAATPGVAALALRDTTATGYNTDGFSGEVSLGYTVPLRLACLRRTHVDPVDLGTMWIITTGTLPDFDSASDWPALEDVNKQWGDVRAEADLALMRRLLAAAQEAAGRRLPFLVEQRGISLSTDWWGLWDDSRAPLPKETVYATDYAALAHAQSRRNFFDLQSWSGASAGELASNLQQMKPGWDGVLLDFGPSETGDCLANLAKRRLPSALAQPVAPAKR